MIVFWFIVALGGFWCGVFAVWTYKTNKEFRMVVKKWFLVFFTRKKINLREKLKYYDLKSPARW